MDTLQILTTWVLRLMAYLFGSIPFGLVLTRVFASRDPRQEGSGNIGATNVRRVAGTVPAVLTLAGDVIKGAAPVYLAVSLGWGDILWRDLYSCLVGLAAFMGHLYPVYLRCRSGGKGVATAAGCFLILAPWALAIGLLIFILCVCGLKRASLGSLAASAAMPIAVWKTTGSAVLTGFAGTTSVLIFIRHKENIQRLLAGKEPPV